MLGDLNDFDFSQTADILTATAATWSTCPARCRSSERYTYVFEGNSQVLDHILLSSGRRPAAYDYDVVHVNAEFADQASDHDPQVVRIQLS